MKSALERRRSDLPARPPRRMDRAAVSHLKGYRPLARRYAAAGGEIDLIVMRGDTIAFVEVKARGLMDDALIAITATQAPALLPRRTRLALAQRLGREQDMARRCGVHRTEAMAAAHRERVRVGDALR